MSGLFLAAGVCPFIHLQRYTASLFAALSSVGAMRRFKARLGFRAYRFREGGGGGGRRGRVEFFWAASHDLPGRRQENPNP